MSMAKANIEANPPPIGVEDDKPTEKESSSDPNPVDSVEKGSDSEKDEDVDPEERERRRQRIKAILADLAKYYAEGGRMRAAVKDTTLPIQAPDTFSILSWNLDGLDDEGLKERTKSVFKLILQTKPAVAFFQELVPKTYLFLVDLLSPEYIAIPGTEHPPAGYQTGTFLNRSQVQYVESYIKDFPNSDMGRNLLVTTARIGKLPIALLNTHLESGMDCSEERVSQLKTCFEIAKSFPPEYNVLFGGDLNLRDKEVIDILPKDMLDLWIEDWSLESKKYTWDSAKNTNKVIELPFKPRCRFDRFYFRHSQPRTLNFAEFDLTGMRKVEGINRFPSDHWGIVCKFRFVKNEHKYFEPAEDIDERMNKVGL